MNTPDRIGKYRITEVLGKGAMGVVYKAEDPVIGRPVAIKTIRKDLAGDPDQAEFYASRFRNEARAAGRLSHPALVGVYEYGEEGDTAFIAMEYVEGRTLREYFKADRRLPDPDILSIVSQMLEGLEYAHSSGVWHRDIKPANVIIMKSGRIKIADFGIARVESGAAQTHIGLVMGTPGFMAPEQYEGKGVDHRVDIFATGAVLYQMITGQSPFSGGTEQVMFQTWNLTPPPVSETKGCERWSPFDTVIARALAKKAEDRFPSAAAFRHALIEAYARPVKPVVSDETITRAPSPVPVSAGPASGASGSSRPISTASSNEPLTGWDNSVLKDVETALTQVVGPMARVLVRRAARQTTDLQTLMTTLADGLPSEAHRRRFLEGPAATRVTTASRTLRTLITRSPAPTPAPTHAASDSTMVANPTANTLTPEAIERISNVFVRSVGPIAKLLVKQAGAKAGRDRERFLAALAEHIPDAKKREAFLKDARAVAS